ncbi:protein of unknown function [Cupriavidus taiwanensis]|nr:protein of unknown function [Cupriavidus taiwanensis]
MITVPSGAGDDGTNGRIQPNTHCPPAPRTRAMAAGASSRQPARSLIERVAICGLRWKAPMRRGRYELSSKRRATDGQRAGSGRNPGPDAGSWQGGGQPPLAAGAAELDARRHPGMPVSANTHHPGGAGPRACGF